MIGAFASIALNEYGVKLIGIGCFGLATIFLLKLYNIYTIEKPKLLKSLLIQEYAVMAIVVALFGLRALRIRFTFVEIIFVICSVFMVYIYIRYLKSLSKKYNQNTTLLYAINLLYLSIILFFISLSLTFISSTISIIAGGLSFAVSLGFLVWYFWNDKTTLYKDDNVNLFQEVFKYLNLSPVILTMILLISFYMGLYQIKVLPPIYTGEVPFRYEELLNNSLTGEGKAIDGVPAHEIYWEEYQKFLSQMKEREKSK